MSYYEVLGVSKSASLTEIIRAYRKEALLWHPDRKSTPEEKAVAEERFKKINEAYECLKDPQSRKEYDTQEKAKPSFTASQATATFDKEFDSVLRELLSQIYEQQKSNRQSNAEIKAVGWGAAGAVAGYVVGAIAFAPVAIPAALVLGVAGALRGYTGNDMVHVFSDLSPELKSHILNELLKRTLGESK